jgi:hypothetical protein
MNTTPKPQVVIRLNADVYAKLEKQLSRTAVTDQTSPIAAGFQLGVEYVLKALRNNIVVDQ